MHLGLNTSLMKLKKNPLAWTSTSATWGRTVAMITPFASTSREATTAAVKPDTTETDTAVKVRELKLVLALHWLTQDFYAGIEDTPCSRVRCAAHSQCVETAAGDPECRCLSGYHDVDNQCQPISQSASDEADCRQQHKCDINAHCVYNSRTDQYRCQCLNGYRGDGLKCTRVSGMMLNIKDTNRGQ